MSYTVAIVGRPNVGKSTIFNRLTGRKLALVDKQPGLTRDRREAEADFGDVAVRLIDTAGLEESEEGSITHRMRTQTEAAIAEADLVMFVIDARSGIVPGDEVFAELVRTAGKPVLLIANKCEGRGGLDGAYEAYQLGLGDPVAISAEHGDGIGVLIREIADLASTSNGQADAEAEGEHALRVAVVGRPNSGKSTLVNALIGEERMITGPEAGITRDSIAVDLTWQERPVRLWDTAGLRRKARIAKRAEQLSVSDALRAIRFAEVVILLIEPERAYEKQDLQIANLIAEEGRALIIAVNKWDLVRDKRGHLAALREQTERLLPQVRGVPIVTISALKEQGLDRLVAKVLEITEIWNKRLATSALNRFLADAVARHTPPAVNGRRIRLRYMTQPNARPPTFIAFCSRPQDLPQSYVRYLINGLRDTFGLLGTPIRLHLRKGKNPYAK